MAASIRKTFKGQKASAPKSLSRSTDAPKRVIAKDPWSGKVRTSTKPSPWKDRKPSGGVTMVHRTVVPDVTNAATYKSLRAKVEADLRADRRNAQIAALRSLMRF